MAAVVAHVILTSMAVVFQNLAPVSLAGDSERSRLDSKSMPVAAIIAADVSSVRVPSSGASKSLHGRVLDSRSYENRATHHGTRPEDGTWLMKYVAMLLDTSKYV